MKIKVTDLKPGQSFKYEDGLKWETAHQVLEFEGGVMVVVDPDNPFDCSQFASFPLDAEVEIV